MAEKLTEKQLQKLKHALGMDHKEPKDGVYEAYRRNSFYNEPDEIWESLRAAGLAKRINHEDDKKVIYVVTDAGMQSVANATGLMIRYELEFEPKEE